MKVLMFSSDPNVDLVGSKTYERMRKYAEVVDKLEIVKVDRAEGKFMRFWRAYRRAKSILQLEKFDLITAQEIEHSFIAYFLSKKLGIPWQMQIHTDIFSKYYFSESLGNKFRVFLAKFLIPRASCLRAVSQRVLRTVKRDAVVLPIFSEIINLGANIIREKYPGFDFYILMVARLSHEKNIKLALSVMRDIVKENNALLVIIGDGEEKKNLEHEVLDGLEANVKFEGWQEDLSGYYTGADVLLITSNYEGYSVSAAEAISLGLPVIMTDVGIAGDVVRDGINGMVVAVGDRYGLLGAILKFFKDEGLRLKLRGGALATAPPYKSFEDYRDKLLNSWRTCQK